MKKLLETFSLFWTALKGKSLKSVTQRFTLLRVSKELDEAKYRLEAVLKYDKDIKKWPSRELLGELWVRFKSNYFRK